MSQIPKESIMFLKKLNANNNRDWFNKNKGQYEAAREGVINFSNKVLEELTKHDNIQTESGKKSLYRIYRDVRFSKNKTPYNVHWSGGFKRATNLLRGGYYFRLEPDNFIVAGGFWGPNPPDLKRIREEIDYNAPSFREIFNQHDFKETFGNISGDEVKTAPKGYHIQNPNIDLLRKKQFILSKKFTLEDVLAKDYYAKVNDTYTKMRPFFDLMSDILTTDANGVSMY